MKRLIKKAFGKTLWHGTSLDSFKSIVENGAIFPNEVNGAGPNGANQNLFDGFSFLATDFEIAKYYATRLSGNNGEPSVIIEVDVSEDALLPDDNDAPAAKTWQESANEVDQVKVNGPIYSDYFQTIYFYDTNGKIVGDVPFGQWETFYEEKESKIYGQEIYDEYDDEEYFEDEDNDDLGLDDEDLDFDFDDEDFDIDDDDDFIDEDILTDDEEAEEEKFDWSSALEDLLKDDQELQTAKTKIKRLRK